MLNPNDLRVRKTRRAITTAFYALLREESFDNISVRQLASRAEIGQTTFYNHYQDKFALASALIQATTTQLTALFLAQCHLPAMVAPGAPGGEDPALLCHARLLSKIDTAEVSFTRVAIQHIAALYQHDLGRRGVKLAHLPAIAQHLAVLTYSFITALINQLDSQAVPTLACQLAEFAQVLTGLGIVGVAASAPPQQQTRSTHF
ncbi:TetR/AcrR family transcriptional regulator [Lacticaseibacillus hegangensis]|uniref:TetR/AcrR family transcriptional regulator n=1 Tax=Lacticaseibacillus hegangensis TaxID=2486010 RepID=A0ABW4CYD1_9LACO|nr:TetR/AcrR family transcriptional regulator [Lacticaseibacillus hegangensis]